MTGSSRRLLLLLLSLLLEYFLSAGAGGDNSAVDASSMEDAVLRAEITQTEQLRQLAEAQQQEIQRLEEELHLACDVLWQTDAYMYFQDFSNGDSGEVALKQLKKIGFRPSVVFDIGANTGESAKLLLSLYNDDPTKLFTLHSFEPVPPTFETLSRTILQAVKPDKACDGDARASAELGSHRYCELKSAARNVKAVAHNAAVSNEVGTVEIYDGLDNIDNRKTRSAWATLAKKGTSYGKTPSLKVDTLLYHAGDGDGDGSGAALPPPQLVKCDTEGWDFMVIEGMQEMLAARTAEVLLFEVGDNWSRSGYAKATLGNAAAVLDGAGYDAFLLGDTFHVKLNAPFFQPLFDRHRWGNMLAIRRGSALLSAFECLPLASGALKELPYSCNTRPAC